MVNYKELHNEDKEEERLKRGLGFNNEKVLATSDSSAWNTWNGLDFMKSKPDEIGLDFSFV